MNSMLWVLVGHLLAEFVLVTETHRERQRHFNMTGLRAHAGHALVVGIAIFLALGVQLQDHSLTVFLCTVAITVVHVLIDMSKTIWMHTTMLEKPLRMAFGDVHHSVHALLVFLCINVLHVMALVWITGLFFPPRYDLSQILWYLGHHLLGPERILPDEQIPYVILLGILATFGAAELIRVIVQAFAPPAGAKRITVTETVVAEENNLSSTGSTISIQAKKERDLTGATNPALLLTQPVSQEIKSGASQRRFQRTQRTEEYDEQSEGTVGSGRWIGILERFLIIILVAMNAWQGIAFVFTAKSLARYKQLDNRDFAEYYIIGTLISILTGILFGLLIGEGLGTLT